ncbi:uncharacterized protein LOC143487681 [Brachyhypopomus gauderio]|uniref:uncharacterized protein LOC143487681 n=1 Tax=Brachyhypopomus gauderio TaxID=698409 RepID=UPI0040423B5E
MSVGPAVCRVNQSVTCYGALGQELHLELDDGDEMILFKGKSRVLGYKRNRPSLNHPRWQFIAVNRTIIIPSTEREDSGTYRLDTFDVNGTDKGQYHLLLNIEAAVSSVEVSYSCVSSKRTVSCSSEGDQVHFNWTLSGNRITHQLDDGNRTLLLEKEQVGQITCHVQNHISHGQSSIELHQCPGVMSVGPAVCRVNQSVTCYGALGQELHLELDDGDEMILFKGNSRVLGYKRNRTSVNHPRWQFIAVNRTIIIPSTEREDSGTYRLDTFDVNGTDKGQYHLLLNIEAAVSSVEVSYSCVSSKRTVSCSSEGDQLHFNWTLSGNRITHQLDDGNRTLLLEKEQVGQITCHVQNHISHGQSSIELHQCPGVMSVGPAVCRVNQSVTCYGALGQELHLELDDGDEMILFKGNSRVLGYKRNRTSVNHPRWQFIAVNRTIIIPSTEREDSGTYRLDTFDVNGTDKGQYHLLLNIEAAVSSVEVSYSCVSSKRTVSCSSEGDQLHFSWTLSGNRITHQLDDGNRTLLLEKEQVGQITCHVQNHISHGQSSIELHQCPAAVSSVEVSYSCVSSKRTVSCSSEGDQLHFSWTLSGNRITHQLDDGNRTLLLEKEQVGQITCHVQNHISHGQSSIELHQCPGVMSVGPAVCRVNQNVTCYGALGQELHLELDDGDEITLFKGNSRVLKYKRKRPSQNHTRWQFIADNRTIIIPSTEREDSGTYRLDTFDVNGTDKGQYHLLLNIEAAVSSVEVSYSCVSSKRTVSCSSEGDQLHFSWTLSGNRITHQLDDGNRTLLLEKEQVGQITCHVQNHISHGQSSIELHQCPDFSLVFLCVWVLEIITLLSLLGGFHIYIKSKHRAVKGEEQQMSEVLHTSVDQDV